MNQFEPNDANGQMDEKLATDGIHLDLRGKMLMAELINKKFFRGKFNLVAGFYPIWRNGINLSDTIIKTHWMNILTYLVKNFFVIKIQVPTVVLDDLSGILEIYLVVILQIFRFG